MKGYLINTLTTLVAFTFANLVWAQTYNNTPATTATPTTTTTTPTTTTVTPTTTGTQSTPTTSTMQSSDMNIQQKGVWTCKTNASYATAGSMEEKADHEMENNPKNGTDAFTFALQHCRDCNKITCTMARQ